MPPTSLQFAQHFVAAPSAAAAGAAASELGFSAWTGDPGYTVAGTAGGTAGTLQLRRLAIPGPLSLTNIHLDITTIGAALTANQCFGGVWDSTGLLVGLTADLSTAFTALGLNTLALVGGSGLPGPPFIVDTPYIYVGYWFNGTTGPFLSRTSIVDGGVVNGNASVPNAQARAVTADAGLTVIGTVPQRLGALTRNAAGPFWAGVS